MKTKWNLDTMHSDVQFKVKHLVISTVTGNFGKFNSEVETDGDDFSTAKIHFSIDVNSISTGSEHRDNHLKSAEFFDSANHPTIDFISSAVKRSGENNFQIEGDLTLHGVTKPVIFEAEFGGTMKDPYGNFKAGFEVSGKINRKDFGLNWNALTEAGGVVVSEEVKLLANVQFVKVIAAEIEAATV
jgi:polyisoprenoid-binding protein YceI